MGITNSGQFRGGHTEGQAIPGTPYITKTSVKGLWGDKADRRPDEQEKPWLVIRGSGLGACFLPTGDWILPTVFSIPYSLLANPCFFCAPRAPCVPRSAGSLARFQFFF